MAFYGVVFLVVPLLAIAAQLPSGFALSSMAPAFLWSHDLPGMKVVDYRVLLPRDLAKSVMTEGGWSKYLCSEETAQSRMIAFLFIGKELTSMDITGPSNNDPALVNLLKETFSNSNVSVAFPYLNVAEDEEPIERSIISEFGDSCSPKSEINRIALVGSCHVQGETFVRLPDIRSLNAYLNSRAENDMDGISNMFVLCDAGSSDASRQLGPEGSILSTLIETVNQLGVKYTVLYVSDPYRSSTQSISRRATERFLAEGTIGNLSTNSTSCDSICQTKASLLEGLLVGIVLLIILISGLCCMAGIDTPTRFETPQES